MNADDDGEMLRVDTAEYAAKCWVEPGYVYFEYVDKGSDLMKLNRVVSEAIRDRKAEFEHYIAYGKKEIAAILKTKRAYHDRH